MPKIQVLSEELINKIAAGEVIERPASVVKELVENSLDAGATRILVEIKEYGQKLIKVTDNGEGMDQEDALKAVLRHATSKIRNSEDLFAINTLGFRGEALASIAAVSKFTLTTKQKESLEGFSLILEGGNLLSYGIAAAEKGTTIEVENLFFNTPARKKFLKSENVELKHIIEIIEHYALINPKVSFKLIHDSKEIIQSPSVEEWRDNISSIYGIDTAKKLLEVNLESRYVHSANAGQRAQGYSQDKLCPAIIEPQQVATIDTARQGANELCTYESNGIKVYGFVSKPYDARNDKSQQALFVNRRWVRNEELTKVIYEAYHSLLFVNKHPIFVINIEVDPQKIDVNVHPTKAEIKIEQMKEVSQVVFDAVRETLRQNDLLPVMDLAQEQQMTFGMAVKKEEFSKEKLNPEYKYTFDASEQKGLQVHEEELPYPEKSNSETSFTSPPSGFIGSERIPPFKLLGQIHKTFFVAETPGGVLFIDQHVVQERVLYERFMEQLLNRKVAVQNLLQGEVLELTAAQKIAVLENLSQLREFGFLLEEFGENSFVLKSIPEVFGRLQPKELMFELISGITEGKNRLEEIQEEIITRMACRASVKAGDTLTNAEMQGLLNQLMQTKFPYTCPHGRAVLIKIPVEELERKFRRK